MNSATLRAENVSRVLRSVMNKDEITRTEISSETGLTKTTVGDIVKRFLAIGFLEERKSRPKGVGRPSLVLRVNPRFAHVVGLSIMRDGVEVSVVDSSRRLLWGLSSPFSNVRNLDTTLEKVFDLLDETFKMAEEEHVEIKAIGVGTPGLVDPGSRTVVHSPKFSGFKDVPLGEMLTRRYCVDVWLGNDCDMAAVGEKWFGKGRKHDSFVYVYVVEGIGAGVVLNGQLMHGKAGYTGEIGHLLVEREGRLFYLEELFGLDELLRRARESGIPSDDLGELREAAEDDERARDLIYDFARGIGMGVHAAVSLFGVLNVFIGGKAPELGDLFLQALKRFVLENLFYKRELRIEYSELETSAVSLGAAAHGLEMYLEKVLTAL